MLNHKQKTQLPLLSQQIIKILLYYDIFSYPLTAEEVYFNCQQQGIQQQDVTTALGILKEDNYLKKIGIYFSINKDNKNIQKRFKANALAQKYLPKAYQMSQFIAQFPFVRGICLSGSISKNVMAEDGDIDYFIITEPQRLWIARTFLVVFKKIFLFNSHKYFCVNYFVDTNSLEIEEKNLFTATEIVTLIPTYNSSLYHQFQQANEWRRQYYPNYPLRATDKVGNGGEGSIKKALEWLLKGRFGDWLDSFFMKKTMSYWEKKFPYFDTTQFSIALKSRKSVSKHHPNNFQQKVLQAHQKKIQQFEEIHGVCLNNE